MGRGGKGGHPSWPLKPPLKPPLGGWARPWNIDAFSFRTSRCWVFEQFALVELGIQTCKFLPEPLHTKQEALHRTRSCVRRSMEVQFAILESLFLVLEKWLERELRDGVEWFSWEKQTHRIHTFFSMAMSWFSREAPGESQQFGEGTYPFTWTSDTGRGNIKLVLVGA